MKKLLYIIIALCAVMSCARMGTPDGGWYDDDPPRVIGSSPVERDTNVTTKKITIFFDEYIKLDNPTENVMVSPPQLEAPEIKAAGKKIVVELQDSLKPNTTYTIDFSNAISDNNEGNPMGNYAFTFSTGEKIDTFEVAGNVIDASNLEPVKGISVGLYDNLSDTIFRKEPLMRIGRTDGYGRFVIKGVAPGEYRVYALKDFDDNYRYSQKSEMIAFSHDTFKPSAGPDIRQDTIWRDTLHIDNIVRVPFTHFYPDNIVLLAFQEEQTDRFLIKTERQDANKIGVYFSYGNEQLPVIRGLNFTADSAFVLEASEKKDTLTYWLRDTTLVNNDTLSIEMEYLMTDSTGKLVSQTDTMELVAKTPYAKRLKQQQKEYEEWQKTQEKKKKREEEYDSIYPVKPLEPRYLIPRSMTPNSVVTIEIPTPLEKLDTGAIHLYTKIDSLWYRAPFKFGKVKGKLRQYQMVADWRPNTEYSLELDTLAFTDIYGLSSAPHKQGIKVKSLDEFATLEFQLSGVADTSIVVELLDKSDKMLKQVKAGRDHTATFFYVEPGTYYARAFTDRNSNGIWDTGCYDEDKQPEDVYYYPREIECKEKFDVTLNWGLKEKPRNQQKPAELVKQKPDKEKKKLMNRNVERAKQLGIEYVKKQMVK